MTRSALAALAATTAALLAAAALPAAAEAHPASPSHGSGPGAAHARVHASPVGLAHRSPRAAQATGAKSGPTSIAYVEVNNDQLANVGRYTLADGSNAFDVAIIFAANVGDDGGRAVLTENQNVQATLDAAATQIRPLQAKGIKVTLSVLGNHTGLGISNFTSQAAAADFAQQISDEVSRYGLDGVDLDDEYADYGTNGTPATNQQSIGWLVTALRQDMPGKIVSFYDIGPASSALASSSASVGSQLTYAWNPYYSQYNVPRVPGLGKQSLSPAAVDIQSTSLATAQSLARRTLSDGYGVFMTYDLPDGDDSAYVSPLMQSLYGQTATYR